MLQRRNSNDNLTAEGVRVIKVQTESGVLEKEKVHRIVLEEEHKNVRGI